jgi:flagellar hook assembly protein FlgD
VDLPKSCEVSLVIYDVLGREIVQLMTGEQAAGQYRVRWDGRDRYGNQVPSGIYFYRIEAGEFKQVRKMVLVR